MVALNFYFFANLSDVCLNKRKILISASAFNLLYGLKLMKIIQPYKDT